MACLLAVLMLLSTMSGAVSALSIGNTVNVSGANEWISGFYYNWNGNFGMGGKYGQHQHLHTSDGRPAYCVEPDEHFSSGNKTIRETFDELPITAQRNITAAFLYGYNGNTKYGYSWQTEYVATQAIVWAIAVGAFNTSQETLLQNCAFGGSTSATTRLMPSFFCMALAVRSLSPVSMTTDNPIFSISRMAWALVSLTGSAAAVRPRSFPSAAI